MGSVLGGPTAVYIRASAVASHNSPPLKNKIHPSSCGLVLSSHSVPLEAAQAEDERSWDLASVEVENHCPSLCGFGQVTSPLMAPVSSAVKPETLDYSL